MNQYPVPVPPDRLWWQCGDEGTKRLEDSPHAKSAKEIANGVDPFKTEYAEKITLSTKKTHGNPDKFATLIESMRYGWDGPPIIAGINRRGEIVITDGWHRSAAALALGIETIPVAIHYRSDKWWEFKHAVRKLNHGCKLYQPIDHPDFAHWPVWRKDTKARIDVIAGFLKERGRKYVNDIGCHSGAISFGLHGAGFVVHAVDSNPAAIRVIELQDKMTFSKTSFTPSFSAWCQTAESMEYDRYCFSKSATVALSMLNHAIINGHFEHTIKQVANISPVIIFDCPTPGDPVGGDQEWSNPEVMARKVTDAIGGTVRAIAERGDRFQRTIMARVP